MITFLKTAIKDVLKNVGVWISPSKRGRAESTTKYLPAYPFFFFSQFFLVLLKLILILMKFFVNDTVLVRAFFFFL